MDDIALVFFVISCTIFVFSSLLKGHAIVVQKMFTDDDDDENKQTRKKLEKVEDFAPLSAPSLVRILSQTATITTTILEPTLEEDEIEAEAEEEEIDGRNSPYEEEPQLMRRYDTWTLDKNASVSMRLDKILEDAEDAQDIPKRSLQATPTEEDNNIQLLKAAIVTSLHSQPAPSVSGVILETQEILDAGAQLINEELQRNSVNSVVRRRMKVRQQRQRPISQLFQPLHERISFKVFLQQLQYLIKQRFPKGLQNGQDHLSQHICGETVKLTCDGQDIAIYPLIAQAPRDEHLRKVYATQADHPNIRRVENAFLHVCIHCEEHVLYLIAEQLPERRLREWHAQCTDNVQFQLRLASVLKQCVKALQYLYQNELTCNAIRVEDIYLQDNGVVKIGEITRFDLMTGACKDLEQFRVLCEEIVDENLQTASFRDFMEACNRPDVSQERTGDFYDELLRCEFLQHTAHYGPKYQWFH